MATDPLVFDGSHAEAVRALLPPSTRQVEDVVVDGLPAPRITPKVAIRSGVGRLPVPRQMARRIHARYQAGETIGKLAREYDLGVCTVQRIVHGRDCYAYLRDEVA